MLAILDYEAGNQTSVRRALDSLGIPCRITADREAIASAAGVVFPGVGAAPQAMENLARTGMDATLRELAERGAPLLGICLGCQILLEQSEEGDTPTLGLFPGRCLRFDKELRDEDGEPIIIPHMGWNALRHKRLSPIFKDVPEQAEFYFVHSYYVRTDPELVIATSFHGREFCAAYGRDGFWAVQFHPEKSGRPGLQVLRNFYDYCLERGKGRAE